MPVLEPAGGHLAGFLARVLRPWRPGNGFRLRHDRTSRGYCRARHWCSWVARNSARHDLPCKKVGAALASMGGATGWHARGGFPLGHAPRYRWRGEESTSHQAFVPRGVSGLPLRRELQLDKAWPRSVAQAAAAVQQRQLCRYLCGWQTSHDSCNGNADTVSSFHAPHAAKDDFP